MPDEYLNGGVCCWRECLRHPSGISERSRMQASELFANCKKLVDPFDVFLFDLKSNENHGGRVARQPFEPLAKSLFDFCKLVINGGRLSDAKFDRLAEASGKLIEFCPDFVGFVSPGGRPASTPVRPRPSARRGSRPGGSPRNNPPLSRRGRGPPASRRRRAPPSGRGRLG